MSIRLSLTIAGVAVAAFAALSLHGLRTHADPAADLQTMQAPSPPSVLPRTAESASVDAMPVRPAPMPHASAKPREPADSTQVAARVEAHIATLDNRFVAEPLNADWARRQEREIRAFFHPGALAAEGLDAPSAVQTVCHSLTCRISAEFTDVAQAEVTTQHLAMHLAERLPYGAVMPRQLDDGSIQVHAWYSSARIEL